MNKQELRKKYKHARAQLTEGERDELSLEIANKVLDLDIWNASYYHVFLPIKRLQEIDTTYLLSILHGKDKNIVVSKSDFSTNFMRHFLLTDNTRFVTSKYGIPEPENGIEIDLKSIEVVFIPLLAYDIEGNRIGYGKGFYDKFLAQCSENAIKVGLSFFEPEQSKILTDPTDIPLDFCVSSKKIYKF